MIPLEEKTSARKNIAASIRVVLGQRTSVSMEKTHCLKSGGDCACPCGRIHLIVFNRTLFRASNGNDHLGNGG